MSYLVIKYKTIDGLKSLDHYDDLEVLLDRHKLYLASERRIGFDAVHYPFFDRSNYSTSPEGIFLLDLGSLTGISLASIEHKNDIKSLMKCIMRDNKLNELGI